MRRWHGVGRAMLVAVLTVGFGIPLASAAAPCDEYDPGGPLRTTEITLDGADYTDSERDQMRSFVETDSIGRVEVAIVSANPRDSVLSVSALPEVSRISAFFGEELKGIALNVWVRPTNRPARVTLQLRQVCARHFRNTFLYY